MAELCVNKSRWTTKDSERLKNMQVGIGRVDNSLMEDDGTWDKKGNLKVEKVPVNRNPKWQEIDYLGFTRLSVKYLNLNTKCVKINVKILIRQLRQFLIQEMLTLMNTTIY